MKGLIYFKEDILPESSSNLGGLHARLELHSVVGVFALMTTSLRPLSETLGNCIQHVTEG
jgi:hypothetical protein